MATGNLLTPLLLFFLFSAGLTPQGNLRGVVTDLNGAIVPGALISIEHWSAPDAIKRAVIEEHETVYTDGKGEFSVHLKPGSYDVFVSAPECLPSAKRIKVHAGKETRLSPVLKFDPATQFIE